MLDKILHAQMNAQAPQPRQEVDELDSIGSEEFIPKGKVERLVREESSEVRRGHCKARSGKALQAAG